MSSASTRGGRASMRSKGASGGLDSSPMRARMWSIADGIVREAVVDHSGDVDLHLSAAEGLIVDALADRRLHEVGASQEDRSVALDDERLVRHDRQVGPAGDARTEDGRNLVDALGGKAGVVVEDPPEMIAVREDLVLHRKKDPGRIHQVDHRQSVLHRDLLGAEDLLAGQREPGPSLDRGVVGDHHALATAHGAETDHDPGGRSPAPLLVQTPGSKRAELQKLRPAVDQGLHPLPGQELALLRPAWRRPSPHRPARSHAAVRR